LIGHQLEIGGKGEELLEEGNGLWQPVGVAFRLICKLVNPVSRSADRWTV